MATRHLQEEQEEQEVEVEVHTMPCQLQGTFLSNKPEVQPGMDNLSNKLTPSSQLNGSSSSRQPLRAVA